MLQYFSRKKILLLLSIVLLIGLFSSLAFLCNSDPFSSNETQGTFRLISLKIPSDLNFAGEAVPLHNPEVQKILHREFVISDFWQKQIHLFLIRASFWFPIIEKELAANHIPDDFKYLAIVESGLFNNRSHKGAAGFWQFIPATASSYGLLVNEEVDERLDIYKSTRAACRYFTEANTSLNSWTLSAASFNMGVNGILRQMKQQKIDNYYDLILKRETAKYLFRALAAKTLMQSPESYGIRFKKSQRLKMPAMSFVYIDSTVTDVIRLCNTIGVEPEVLYAFNPWLSGLTLHATKKNRYRLLVPTDVKWRKYSNLITTFGPIFLTPGRENSGDEALPDETPGETSPDTSRKKEQTKNDGIS